jgi:5-hydroxyisourate hydrolase
MSQITTHILDTSKGRPAQGINVILEKTKDQHHWNEIASGITNADGRVNNLLPDDIVLEPGVYRLVFNCGKYFEEHHTPSFYPYITIVFETKDTSHHHVPLLLNPYGYSTYRGS